MLMRFRSAKQKIGVARNSEDNIFKITSNAFLVVQTNLTQQNEGYWTHFFAKWS